MTNSARFDGGANLVGGRVGDVAFDDRERRRRRPFGRAPARPERLRRRAVNPTPVSADSTDEHVGKRVVAQNGRTVGSVEDVRNGSLYVTVGPDADRETLGELGWDSTVNQEVHELNDRHVSTITDETIRLRV